MNQENSVEQDNENAQTEPTVSNSETSQLTPQAQKLQRHKNEIHQRESICEQIEALKDALNPEVNQQFATLSQTWSQLAAIPPEYLEILEKRFQKACTAFENLKQQLQQELEQQAQTKKILDDLATQLTALLPASDLAAAEKTFYAIQTSWNKTYTETSDFAEVASRFNEAREAFTSQLTDYKNKQEQEYLEKKTCYTNTVDLLKKYLQSDDEIKQHHQEIRTIKHNWSADRKQFTQKEEPFVAELEHLFKEFFEKLNLIFQEADWHRWENYTLKEDLIKSAEKMETEENLFDVSHKLKELREKWKEIGQVPREKSDDQWNKFNTVCNNLYEKCHQFFEKLDVEREEHFVSKVKLCEKVEAMLASTNWKETADQIKHIQEEWKTIGPVPKDKDHVLWERFNIACNKFFDKRRAHYDDVKVEQGKNKEIKEKLCEEAETLVNHDWKSGFKIVHDLRDKWKHVNSAKREDEQVLWQRFNTAIDAFYAIIDTQRPDNLLKKQELCKQVHELLDNLGENVHYKTLSAQIDKLMLQWKGIGPVPKENEDSIWEDFNGTIQVFHEKKRNFFDHLKSEKEDNLVKKQALIAQLEELIENNHNWNETADKVKKIQVEWKTIGPVPKEKDKDAWDKFNKVCNSFFNQRRDFFHDMKSQKQDNLKKKIDLCIRIEHIAGISSPEQDISKMKAMSLEEELKFAIMDNSIAPKLSRKDAMDEVKKMQREWKAIGPVPKADDQRIFQRYRRACDAFFGKRD